MSSASPEHSDAATGDWPVMMPALDRRWHTTSAELHAPGVTLREVQPGDAVALMTLLTAVDVSRVARQRPCSLADLSARIDEARMERLQARGLCLAIVPAQVSAAVGLFHVREIAQGFTSAEWDFVLAPEYWGRGLFFRVAPLVVDYVFDVIGAARLESRTPLDGRSQGALRKLGAVQEALLRRPSELDDGSEDELLWAILASEWRRRTGRLAVH